MFRGGIIQRQHHSGILAAPQFMLSGNTEIDQMDAAVFSDYDILRFDIPVDDRRSLIMKILQDLSEFQCNAQNILCAEDAFFGHDIVEGTSFHIFTDKTAFSILLKSIKYFGYAGMIETVEQESFFKSIFLGIVFGDT